jgi:hypothetical protein
MTDADDRTPFEKLDDAVREYVRECGDEGHVTAWALPIETMTLTADAALLPVGHATTFVMGPTTSPAHATGLLSAAKSYVLDHAMPQDYDPDEDDD